MRAILLALLLLPLDVLAGPDRAAEEAYQQARKSYYALKGDAARRRFRHHWLNVAHKFEAVAAKHPQSARAPDALFTAAELLAELSRISLLEEDLHGAVADYQRLLEGHPRHRLADDAALALGRIYAERLGQPEAARKVLAGGLERTPKGDRAPQLKALHASLESARRPEAEGAPARSSLAEAIARAAQPAPPARPSPEGKVPGRAVKVERETPAGPSAQAAVREEIAVEKAAPTPRREGPAVAAPSPEVARVAPATARERIKQVRPRIGEITLAEQLGLKVRRVVIDAGHGGHDTGAIGPSGVREKDVALAISRRLGEILTEAGLEVLLTREDDTFVRLEDRARLANEAKGDLFISVHCNSAANPKLRGIETYTLNLTSDRYSIRLAARENSSSAKGISDLQFILADLATKANTEESTRLATRVQRSLTAELGAKHPGIKDLGTKEALFYVLLGAKMPAILVETAFLSHPEEEKRLASKGYQEDVARAIADGVQEFLGYRQRLAKVD